MFLLFWAYKDYFKFEVRVFFFKSNFYFFFQHIQNE